MGYCPRVPECVAKQFEEKAEEFRKTGWIMQVDGNIIIISNKKTLNAIRLTVNSDHVELGRMKGSHFVTLAEFWGGFSKDDDSMVILEKRWKAEEEAKKEDGRTS